MNLENIYLRIIDYLGLGVHRLLTSQQALLAECPSAFRTPCRTVAGQLRLPQWVAWLGRARRDPNWRLEMQALRAALESLKCGFSSCDQQQQRHHCLLYTSDAADEEDS